ncbi:hypothetical protein [Desulforamulus hydrothermalis]|uniref:hypothetical protein n=1 Tax=Desulforamulus hydrothermalis TaxID=412895 RepID=UPI0011603562|nr:hypothetical protein [Desulforamulus hydrothermalis]
MENLWKCQCFSLNAVTLIWQAAVGDSQNNFIFTALFSAGWWNFQFPPPFIVARILWAPPQRLLLSSSAITGGSTSRWQGIIKPLEFPLSTV